MGVTNYAVGGGSQLRQAVAPRAFTSPRSSYDAAPSQYYGGGGSGLTTHYNDERFSNSVNAILVYAEGSFGALIMLIAGFLSLIFLVTAPKEKKKLFYGLSLACLIFAVSAFFVRSLLATFFNDTRIQALEIDEINRADG
jgi:hypothetical protein